MSINTHYDPSYAQGLALSHWLQTCFWFCLQEGYSIVATDFHHCIQTLAQAPCEKTDWGQRDLLNFLVSANIQGLKGSQGQTHWHSSFIQLFRKETLQKILAIGFDSHYSPSFHYFSRVQAYLYSKNDLSVFKVKGRTDMNAFILATLIPRD